MGTITDFETSMAIQNSYQIQGQQNFKTPNTHIQESNKFFANLLSHFHESPVYSEVNGQCRLVQKGCDKKRKIIIENPRQYRHVLKPMRNIMIKKPRQCFNSRTGQKMYSENLESHQPQNIFFRMN